jgi:type IV secretory pathway VirB10-like protein
MRNSVRYVLVAAVAATLLAPPAAAQAQQDDPEKGSPSGTIYEIPLDSARDDAAPPAPTAVPEEPVSPIRSENGFGSSSEVPGAAPRERERPRERRQPRRERQRDDDAPARPQAPVSTAPDDDGGAAERLVSSTAGVGGEPSTTRAYLLLALGALIAVGLGAAARRAG